jgi:hypothetical protein
LVTLASIKVILAFPLPTLAIIQVIRVNLKVVLICERRA